MLAAGVLLLAGCTSGPEAPRSAPRSEPVPEPVPETASETASETTAGTVPRAQPTRTTEPVDAAYHSDGTPRRAVLSIPAIAVRDLVVVPYRGRTDDAPGTEIQDGGRAASPFGPRGGVGPGGIGNFQVTAHRTSSTRAFELLPDLRPGALVRVEAGGVRYVYRIVDTRQTSFRSPASLREQRAAVPGQPGVEPSRAMITLSTCATQEDHAAGNWWADRFGNPEHRIDKVGVLVASRPA
jgi:sortase A